MKKAEVKPTWRYLNPLDYLYQRAVRWLAGHPFLRIIGLLLVLVIFGTGGYMIIEGWSALDALYMTTITMTTIGYGEVKSLSVAGRIFTIGLIVIGVITASYALTATIERLTSREFLRQIRNRRRQRILDKIGNHCIICGFGRMGRSLASELQIRGTTIIVIDPDPEAIEKCDRLDIPAILGDASTEDNLHRAGLERANSLVTTTASDAQNVFIVLTARSIRPDLEIIARCNSESSVPTLQKAGANAVISPYSIAGQRIAHMLTHPNVTNFLDGVLQFGDHQMRLEEFVIGPDSYLAGKTLREAKLNAVVLAVDHPGEAVYTHPSADTELLPGMAFIAMGIDRELNKLAQQIKDHTN